MKVIMMKGFSKTGKTTTAEAVIGELLRRGHSVGSVKDIHAEAFTMETAGSDTDRHKEAGAQPVTARGRDETNLMYRGTLDIETVLDFYPQDYVILEGDSGANCPVILTGKTEKDLEEKFDSRAIAVSGVVSQSLKEYKGLPVIDALTDVKKLVDLIEAKTPERMPNYPDGVCKACGLGCKGMLEKILRGEGNLSECTLQGHQTQVAVNGEQLPMKPFVKNMVRSVTLAMLNELNGVRPDSEIVITIK